MTLSVAVSADPMSMKACDFRNDMRRLWDDHVVWTRLYIVSFAANLPDQELVSARLIQNQTDIGNAIKAFYGDDAGNKLTALLKEHILGAVAVLQAAKAGDKTQLDAANQKWYSNADEIAAFLSAANPKNWPLETMKTQMKEHLDLTLNEASNRLNGKYAEDIKDFDKIEDHILHLADTLSAGIENQFPNKFK